MPQSKTMRFFLTDVFAEEPLAGNQLATFLDIGSLDASSMQKIAREINFSETTFIVSSEERQGGYDVRIFTPTAELPFAGHPTLGTAHVLQRHVLKGQVGQITLNLGIGPVPVFFSGGDNTLWMRQAPPTFGRQYPPERLVPVLGVTLEDIDGRAPIETVSTGLDHVIVPLRTMDALRRVCIDRKCYDGLFAGSTPGVILVFCPAGYNDRQKLGVRVFPIPFGIAEDPATGSGNGCLAAYLAHHRFLGSSQLDIAAGQGYEIGRPSTLYLRVADKNGILAVQVGGKVRDVAEGRWSSGDLPG